MDPHPLPGRDHATSCGSSSESREVNTTHVYPDFETEREDATHVWTLIAERGRDNVTHVEPHLDPEGKICTHIRIQEEIMQLMGIHTLQYYTYNL
jgi:hypothetical protein